ncbi:MAG: hypothetical protein A2Z95_02160 [Gallionellales bacterium GWA2_60_18]|nr:MAG: hypothetical protein A2Z95_02160 [Gallionellales bacterium GWA2_60_18]
MKSEKNNSAPFTIAAWLVGLVVFAGTYHLLLDVVADSLGLFTITELTRPGPGRVALDGGNYAILGSVLSIFIGIWTGRIVYSGNAHGGASEENWTQYKAFLVGVIVMLVLTAITQIAFRQFDGVVPGLIHFAVDALALLGVAWSCREWQRTLLKEICNKAPDTN